MTTRGFLTIHDFMYNYDTVDTVTKVSSGHVIELHLLELGTEQSLGLV